MDARTARIMAAAEAPAGPDCVGFADCPCRRCRATRLLTFDAHPNHDPRGNASYCIACRQGSGQQATCWRGECRNGCYYPDVCSERRRA